MSKTILPLKTHALKFERDGQCLLGPIDLDLDAGPLTLIIGPNGAGKSLLLRLCHGLLQPTSGEVLWAQKARRGEKGRSLAANQSFVFQHPKHLNRTCFENVEYPLKVRGVPAHERKAPVEKILARTGLAQMADRMAFNLSGGEQQKLSLARAWVTQPQVLFLDEPTASLDPKSTSDMEVLIRVIHESGTKVIMTSHDLAQVRRLADEIVFLHQGQVIEKGPAKQILDTPKNPETAGYLRGDLLV